MQNKRNLSGTANISSSVSENNDSQAINNDSERKLPDEVKAMDIQIKSLEEKNKELLVCRTLNCPIKFHLI